MKTEEANELAIREMRDIVYGRISTDENWYYCRENWMQPQAAQWLKEQVKKRMKILLKKNNKPKKPGWYILNYAGIMYLTKIGKDPFTGIKHAFYGVSCVSLHLMSDSLLWSDAIEIEEEK